LIAANSFLVAAGADDRRAGGRSLAAERGQGLGRLAPSRLAGTGHSALEGGSVAFDHLRRGRSPSGTTAPSTTEV
jgi:hypothetical protein